MNLQGDEPEIKIEDIKSLKIKMVNSRSRMGTLAVKIKNLKDLKNKNIVKVITKNPLNNDEFSEAKAFVRSSSDVPNIYHHVGIYCYSIETLKAFVELNQSKNEIKNRLEQLRALDNNIAINVAIGKSSPIGVDTKEDYIALKKIMEYKSS
jgi:3-deoxy-manno-octulosonate cytidylyltransferase (CMP-KDO synthetase)